MLVGVYEHQISIIPIERWRKYLLNMSVTRSISASAAAIFSADEGCGRPNPPNIDIFAISSPETRKFVFE